MAIVFSHKSMALISQPYKVSHVKEKELKKRQKKVKFFSNGVRIQLFQIQSHQQKICTCVAISRVLSRLKSVPARKQKICSRGKSWPKRNQRLPNSAPFNDKSTNRVFAGSTASIAAWMAQQAAISSNDLY